MHVTVNSQDEQLARRAALALHPLCDILSGRSDQDACTLQVTSGVVIAKFHARDGTAAQVAVGIRPLAAALIAGTETLTRYADQLCRWATAKQATARNTRGLGIWIPA